MSDSTIKQIISSGTQPLELEYYPIFSVKDLNENVGFRSVLRINSPEIGVIYPKEYSIVANRTVQSVKLSTFALNNFLINAEKILKNKSDDFFVSIYCPSRMLLKNELLKLFDSYSDDKKMFLKHVVLEFSTEILLGDMNDFSVKLKNLKEKFGVKLLLSDFGDDFCPVLRLSELPFDYVILEKTLTDEKNITSVNTRSVVSLVNENSMNVITLKGNYQQFFDIAHENNFDFILENSSVKPTKVCKC